MRHNSVVFLREGHTGAGTHVLIIGISEYPYLLGGKKERTDISEGMEQIGTPRHSARALANWFLDHFCNPDQPLASLALILSESPPAKFNHPLVTSREPVPLGSAEEVSDALDAWVERAQSDRDNQTIFFFCGHGISSSEPILLLRDFGRLRNNSFDGALNLNDFVSAMQTKAPEYQLFLIDACRSPGWIATQALGKPHVGRQGVAPSNLDDRGGEAAKQSVQYASSLLAPAFGRKDAPSLFTEALIQALNGGGAQPNLRWWVGTHGLATALGAYLARLAKKEKVTQVPEAGRVAGFRIHKPEMIRVPLYVTSEPKEAMQVARVEALLGGIQKACYDYKQNPCDEWSTILEHREHVITACFPVNSGYRDVSDVLPVAPPEMPYVIQVQRGP